MEFTAYTEIEVTVVCSTSGALRLSYEGDEQWVPRSLIERGDEDYGDGEVTDVSIAEWKLDQLGWIA